MSQAIFPPLTLMHQRIEAHYKHDPRGRIEIINQWDGGIAPRFYLGCTSAGNLWRFRTDVPDDLADKLQAWCEQEPDVNELAGAPRYQEATLRLLSAHAPISHVWTGPAYWFTTDVTPKVQAVAITEGNADLLRGGLEAWMPDVSHRQPFMAIVENGQAVALCASVRITDVAHEAGVETLPSYRQRGHAVNVVAGWAIAVRKMGAIPFYSTSWDNIASQNVAAKLGLSLLGVDFHVI